MKDWKAWRQQKLEQGLCTHCGTNPIAFDRSPSRCEVCLDSRAKRARELREQRRLENLCPYCSQPKLENRITCGKCPTFKRNNSKRPKKIPSIVWKLKFIEAYGGKCACCGETEIMFLTADHINRDGNKDRIRDKYRRYVQNPRTDIRILCFNCNCGRELNNGICPHDKLK